MEFLRKELLKIKNGDSVAEENFYKNITDYFSIEVPREYFTEWIENHVRYINDKELIKLVEEMIEKNVGKKA